MVFGASSYGVPQDAGMTRTRNDRQITVRINDYAHVKSPVLVQAEQTAGDILGKAGVDTIWVECQGGQTSPADVACAAPMTPLDFILNVLPRSMFQPLHPQEGVLGRALESTGKDFGFFAYIFYDSVKDCAGQFDLGQYLGDVFAHELGHLLLGTKFAFAARSDVRLSVAQGASHRRTARRPVLLLFRNEAHSDRGRRPQAGRLATQCVINAVPDNSRSMSRRATTQSLRLEPRPAVRYGLGSMPRERTKRRLILVELQTLF
jgi:hypothetical protein